MTSEPGDIEPRGFYTGSREESFRQVPPQSEDSERLQSRSFRQVWEELDSSSDQQEKATLLGELRSIAKQKKEQGLFDGPETVLRDALSGKTWSEAPGVVLDARDQGVKEARAAHPDMFVGEGSSDNEFMLRKAFEVAAEALDLANQDRELTKREEAGERLSRQEITSYERQLERLNQHAFWTTDINLPGLLVNDTVLPHEEVIEAAQAGDMSTPGEGLPVDDDIPLIPNEDGQAAEVIIGGPEDVEESLPPEAFDNPDELPVLHEDDQYVDDIEFVDAGEEDERTGARREKPEAKEYPVDKEAWVKYLFERLEKIERRAYRDLKRSDEISVVKDMWADLEEDLEHMTTMDLGPDDRNNTEIDQFLAERFAHLYPEGVGFKQRIQIYFEARRNLMNRYVECDVRRSNGSLVKLGMVDEMPFEGIAIHLEDIAPMTFWLTIHSDEIFQNDLPNRPLTEKENKELEPNVDQAMSVWWEVGMSGYKGDEAKDYLRDLFGRDVPTYAEALLDSDKMVQLRAAIQRKVGKQAETLAHRLMTCTFTFDLFDRDREAIGGQSEVRDKIIHFERKRWQDYIQKGRDPAGDDYTIGLYFKPPGMEDPDQKVLQTMGQRMKQYRLQRLGINATRHVYDLNNNYDFGEIGSDVFHSLSVPVFDELTGKAISRKLISFAVDAKGNPIPGGWKRIPFHHLANDISYSGYITYAGKIQTQITKDVAAGGHKIEELTDHRLWNARRTTFDRLKNMSPWFNSLEYDLRGVEVRRILRENGFTKQETAGIAGYHGDKVDLVGLTANRKDIAEQILNRQGYGNNIHQTLVNAGFSAQEALRIVPDPFSAQANLAGLSLEQRSRAEQILKRENYSDRLTTNTKAEADYEIADKLAHMRLAFALGEVWDGSIDFLRGTQTTFDTSRFSQGQLNDIIRAVKTSEFLPSHYLHDFWLLTNQEMGFGSVIATNIRIVSPSELYMAEKELPAIA